MTYDNAWYNHDIPVPIPLLTPQCQEINKSSTNDMQEIKVRITSRHNKLNREISAPTKTLTRNMSNLIQIKRTPEIYRTTHSKQVSICSLNPRSVKNKTQSVFNFITTNNFDIVALTETWLHKSTDKQIINEIVPLGFEIKHVPRPENREGGGVAIIFKSTISIKVLDSTDLPEKGIPGIEFMECEIKIRKKSTRLLIMYRPTPSTKNGDTTKYFLNEWPKFLRRYAVLPCEVVIVGDLNFHLDINENKDTVDFNNIMEEFGFHQHIQQPTHAHGRTLDVLITRKHSIAVSNINILDPGLVNKSGQYIDDHKAVTFRITTMKPPTPEKNISFRQFNKIDDNAFKQDMKQLSIMQINETHNLSTYSLVELYNSSLKLLLD